MILDVEGLFLNNWPIRILLESWCATLEPVCCKKESDDYTSKSGG